MKAAEFFNAVSFNLQEVVVLYEPHLMDDQSSNDSADLFVQTPIYIETNFAVSISAPAASRQRALCT